MNGLVTRANEGVRWIQKSGPTGPMPVLSRDEWTVALWHHFVFKESVRTSVQEAMINRVFAVIAAGHVKWDDDVGPIPLVDMMLAWTRYPDIQARIREAHELAA